MGSITVITPDGAFSAYLAAAPSTPAPTVVVLHEAFGVNADMRAWCDELAAQGFNALCPDLYWRQQPGLQLSDKAVDWPQAAAFYEALDLDKAVDDVRATMSAAKELAIGDGKVGVMGFCLGALLTYLAAVRGGVEVGVCYHGARTDEFLGEATRLDGPLLIHFGDQDEFISPPAQRAVRAVLLPLGVEIHTYPGCHHAFARHHGEHFDADAALKANTRTLAFLRRHLGSGVAPA
jgi:carboxymethylenebutenolidase